MSPARRYRLKRTLAVLAAVPTVLACGFVELHPGRAIACVLIAIPPLVGLMYLESRRQPS